MILAKQVQQKFVKIYWRIGLLAYDDVRIGCQGNIKSSQVYRTQQTFNASQNFEILL